MENSSREPYTRARARPVLFDGQIPVTMPLGLRVEVDADAGTIRMLERVRRSLAVDLLPRFAVVDCTRRPAGEAADHGSLLAADEAPDERSTHRRSADDRDALLGRALVNDDAAARRGSRSSLGDRHRNRLRRGGVGDD